MQVAVAAAPCDQRASGVAVLRSGARIRLLQSELQLRRKLDGDRAADLVERIEPPVRAAEAAWPFKELEFMR